MSLETILSLMTSILTTMFDWVGLVMGAIVDSPILLIFVVGSFALISIGIVRRLLKL